MKSPTYRRPVRRALLLLAAALAVPAGWAQQQRPVPLPANGIYGEMKAFQYPQAQIDKKTLRLSPGAKVFSTQNLVLMPGMVPASAPVLYRLDVNGQITQMWLLTPDEARAAKQKAKSAKP
jgi:hypothetical protein